MVNRRMPKSSPMKVTHNFSLPHLLKRRALFYRLLTSSRHFGQSVGADASDDLAATICAVVTGDQQAVYTAIRQLIGQLVGHVLDEPEAEKLAIRLSGWECMLCKGVAFQDWTPSDPASINLLHVETVERTPSDRRSFYRCVFLSISGRASGQIFSPTLPAGFLQMAIRAAGGKKYGDYLNEDFGGLYIIAQVQYRDSRICLDNLTTTSAIEKTNKVMLRARSAHCALEGRPCYNCFRGSDLCAKARHRHTYAMAACRNKKPYPHRYYIAVDGYCLKCLELGNFEQREKKKKKGESE